MKKALSLLLCLTMLLVTLVGCTEEDEDKGAEIPVYLSTEINTFDPAYAYTDDASIKVLGLIYEGLTRINAKGKIEGAAAKSWTYKSNPDEGTYILEFNLVNTSWSDGRQVSADDFVYAWKRIMEPEFQSEAASMLYCIKNAKEVKMGDLSIDDLGIYAADTTLFQVEFSYDIDLNTFLTYCASPMLVPLREDSVNKVEDWSTNVSVITTNGPFTIRNFEMGVQLTIERNIYYRRDVDNDSIKKYVTPYRLVIDCSKDSAAQLQAYNNGTSLFIGEIPLSERAAYADQVTLTDSMFTHTYFFNTTRAPFDNADVRRGLSLAIDRTALANIVVYAKAATGIINGDGVFENDYKTSFSSVSGDLISSSANLETAKSLVSGATTKSFTITIKPNEVDRAVAEYCASVWGQLGFDVSIEELSAEKWETDTEYVVYNDVFGDRYESRDFDVIAIDWLTSSSDAWSMLAPFAKQFSGSAKNLVAGEFEDVPHITGYDSETYNTLIDEIYSETDKTTRLSKLHEAEKILVEDMPVMPLFTYQNAYMISDEISKTSEVAWYGYVNFQKANFKNYATFETTLITVADDANVTVGDDE